MKDKPKRTLSQNSSIHKWCKDTSEMFNKKGITFREAIRIIEESEVDWCMQTVKEIVWKPMQWRVCREKSTTELDVKEVSKVYRNIDVAYGEAGIGMLDFPSMEDKLLREQGEFGVDNKNKA